MAADLQVVYVNYFACEHLVRSVETLLEATTQSPSLEITVVDNSCDPNEARALAECLPSQVRVITAENNQGFARGCNFGASFGRTKHILFLNPDTLVPSGTLQRLWQELERRDGRALVGPRHYADTGMQFAHAPLRGVRLLDEVWDTLYAHGWDNGRPLRYLRARSRLANTQGPVRIRALSGGCLAVGRATFDALGGWDENYWMYGEDVELCVRARRQGIEVLYFPDIPIIHFMEASSRLLPQRIAESQTKGRMRFKRSRYGRVRCNIDEWLTAQVRKRLPCREDPWRAASELGSQILAAPPSSERWAVEIARSPLFDNCLTAFPGRRSIKLPRSLIDWLPQATYYVRVVGEMTRNRWWQSSLARLTTVSKCNPTEGEGRESSIPVRLDKHVS